MRIIDCFPYFDEKELLELRINLLYEHVDKFIICDADRSYDGKPKPFTCKNVIDTLGLPKEKIQILEVNLPNNHINSWTSPSLLRERMQRNAAESLMEDGDIFIISNLDEIINPDFIEYYSNVVTQNPNNILRIPMAFLKDGANSRVYGHDNQPITWNAAFLCMKNHLNEYTFSDIRESYIKLSNYIQFPDIFVTENNVVEDAGWKFFISNNSNEVAEDHILKPYPLNLLPQKIFDLERVKNFLIPEKTWKDIDGFFEYPSFYDMCMDQISDNSIMVEVGSWMGRSSTYVASLIKESKKNIKFYCVDTWEGSEEHTSIIKSLVENGKTLFDEFKKNIKECGVEDYITPIKMDSVKASEKFEDGSIDFVHIDAAHDYDNVLKDIKSWYPKVKPGGLVTGDDYGWDGVFKAVNEFFGAENIIYYDHDNKNGNVWLYRKPVSNI